METIWHGFAVFNDSLNAFLSTEPVLSFVYVFCAGFALVLLLALLSLGRRF